MYFHCFFFEIFRKPGRGTCNTTLATCSTNQVYFHRGRVTDLFSVYLHRPPPPGRLASHNKFRTHLVGRMEILPPLYSPTWPPPTPGGGKYAHTLSANQIYFHRGSATVSGVPSTESHRSTDRIGAALSAPAEYSQWIQSRVSASPLWSLGSNRDPRDCSKF